MEFNYPVSTTRRGTVRPQVSIWELRQQQRRKEREQLKKEVSSSSPSLITDVVSTGISPATDGHLTEGVQPSILAFAGEQTESSVSQIPYAHAGEQAQQSVSHFDSSLPAGRPTQQSAPQTQEFALTGEQVQQPVSHFSVNTSVHSVSNKYCSSSDSDDSEKEISYLLSPTGFNPSKKTFKSRVSGRRYERQQQLHIHAVVVELETEKPVTSAGIIINDAPAKGKERMEGERPNPSFFEVKPEARDTTLPKVGESSHKKKQKNRKGSKTITHRFRREKSQIPSGTYFATQGGDNNSPPSSPSNFNFSSSSSESSVSTGGLPGRHTTPLAPPSSLSAGNSSSDSGNSRNNGSGGGSGGSSSSSHSSSSPGSSSSNNGKKRKKKTTSPSSERHRKKHRNDSKEKARKERKLLAGLKVRSPPTYSGEVNLEKFDQWTFAYDNWVEMHALNTKWSVRFSVHFAKLEKLAEQKRETDIKIFGVRIAENQQDEFFKVQDSIYLVWLKRQLEDLYGPEGAIIAGQNPAERFKVISRQKNYVLSDSLWPGEPLILPKMYVIEAGFNLQLELEHKNNWKDKFLTETSEERQQICEIIKQKFCKRFAIGEAVRARIPHRERFIVVARGPVYLIKDVLRPEFEYFVTRQHLSKDNWDPVEIISQGILVGKNEESVEEVISERTLENIAEIRTVLLSYFGPEEAILHGFSTETRWVIRKMNNGFRIFDECYPDLHLFVPHKQIEEGMIDVVEIYQKASLITEGQEFDWNTYMKIAQEEYQDQMSSIIWQTFMEHYNWPEDVRLHNGFEKRFTVTPYGEDYEVIDWTDIGITHLVKRADIESGTWSVEEILQRTESIRNASDFKWIPGSGESEGGEAHQDEMSILSI
ncbi:hypothetical protein M422DRAFT_45202 [Sphaerobolus stellatus SS14]|nr:hypothetical protein M422DRAFT_45202 [Sphaerobolus stellatus SS14]